MRTDFFSNAAFKPSWAASDDQARALDLAALARQALIAEAELTPKPGLVDRRGAGAHRDLSLAIMTRSALAIEPYLREMALFSWKRYPSQLLRERLAVIGREAEHAMLKATSGSNAHKGAIWLLGLLTSASAMQDRDHASASTVAETAKKIASFEDRASPRLVSHGDLVAKKYGVAGARGEALGGFPHVVEIGLPILHSTRASGATETVARLNTLFGIMAHLDDTCLLFRGGEQALVAAQTGAAAVEDAGGSGTALGKQRMKYLDDRLLELDVSPGGSGDLLAAALFLDAVELGRNEVQPDQSRPEEIYGAN